MHPTPTHTTTKQRRHLAMIVAALAAFVLIAAAGCQFTIPNLGAARPTIAGQVRHNDGSASAGLPVALVSATDEEMTATTDSDGKFAFSIVPGTYRIRAGTHYWYGGSDDAATASTFEVGWGDTTTHDVDLPVGPSRLSGTVTEGGVEPMVGGAVRAFVVDPSGQPSLVAETSTDELGRYDLTGINATVKLLVSEGGCGTLLSGNTIRASEAEQYALAPGEALEASTIVMAADAPVRGSIPGVAGLTVTAWNDWFPLAQATTGADGTFVIDGVTPGDGYTFVISDQSGAHGTSFWGFDGTPDPWHPPTWTVPAGGLDLGEAEVIPTSS